MSFFSVPAVSAFTGRARISRGCRSGFGRSWVNGIPLGKVRTSEIEGLKNGFHRFCKLAHNSILSTVYGGFPDSDPVRVNLTASGEIDGNGENNSEWNGPEATRPMAIFVALSKNVAIRYIQVVNSGMWSVVNFENENVVVQYVRVDSHSGPTRDGLDIVDSTHVLIDHCDINSENDSICLKSGSSKGLHDVRVQNSLIRNSWGRKRPWPLNPWTDPISMA